MKACAASLFCDDFRMTIVSAQRSLPSVGTTNLMSGFSAVP